MTDTNDPTASSGSPDARLGVHEATYLAMVGEQLDGLPAATRAELLAVVADHLDERPPALSWDLLLADLGTPATYAAQLVDGPIPRARRTPKQRLQRRRRWMAGLFVAAVAVGLIAPLISRPLRRTIAPPPPVHFSTSCWGVHSDDPRFTFEHLEAAGAQEYRMDYLEGATFNIPLCLSTSQKIEVLDVRAFDDYVENPGALPPSDPRSVPWTYPFRPVGLAPGGFDLDLRTPPTEGSPVALGPNSALDIDLVMQFGTCHVDRGSRTGVSQVMVTYRYDGEEISEVVDLGAAYSVRDVGSCTHES